MTTLNRIYSIEKERLLYKLYYKNIEPPILKGAYLYTDINCGINNIIERNLIFNITPETVELIRNAPIANIINDYDKLNNDINWFEKYLGQRGFIDYVFDNLDKFPCVRDNYITKSRSYYYYNYCNTMLDIAIDIRPFRWPRDKVEEYNIHIKSWITDIENKLEDFLKDISDKYDMDALMCGSWTHNLGLPKNQQSSNYSCQSCGNNPYRLQLFELFKNAIRFPHYDYNNRSDRYMMMNMLYNKNEFNDLLKLGYFIKYYFWLNRLSLDSSFPRDLEIRSLQNERYCRENNERIILKHALMLKNEQDNSTRYTIYYEQCQALPDVQLTIPNSLANERYTLITKHITKINETGTLGVPGIYNHTAPFTFKFFKLYSLYNILLTSRAIIHNKRIKYINSYSINTNYLGFIDTEIVKIISDYDNKQLDIIDIEIKKAFEIIKSIEIELLLYSSNSDYLMEQEFLDNQVIEQERLEKEDNIIRLEYERLEQESIERERLKQEKLAQERLEKERIRREKIEQERLERIRLDQERREHEIRERERLEHERIRQEIIRRERLEQERIRHERLEQERIRRERVEQERVIRLERERVDQLEQARLRYEHLQRQDHDILERDRLARERIERERVRQERRATRVAVPQAINNIEMSYIELSNIESVVIPDVLPTDPLYNIVSQMQCSICLTNQINITFRCSHSFCNVCVKQLLYNENHILKTNCICPKCRQPLVNSRRIIL